MVVSFKLWKRAKMVCSGFKPGAAGWRVKTDPLGAMINKVASHWDRLMMTLKTIESRGKENTAKFNLII